MASHMGHSHTVHVGLHAETRKRRRKGAVSVFTLKNFNDRKERRRNRRKDAGREPGSMVPSCRGILKNESKAHWLWH